MTNLLDLPLLDLGRIAALVSGGDSCRYASLPFQVVCRHSEWNNLLPLKQTCKVLLEACSIAVGGLEVGDFTVVPVKTVCSMPCVTELAIMQEPSNVESIMTLLQQLKSLKVLVLSVDVPILASKDPDASTVSLYNRLASLPSSRTLRELVIYGDHSEMIVRILSFPYDRLTKLELHNRKSARRIPCHILRTLKSFVLHGSLWEPPLAIHEGGSLHPVRAPLLQHLELTDLRNFQLLTAAQPQDRFKCLETLSFPAGAEFEISDKPGMPNEPLGITRIIQAARNGCFPKLRVLEINFPAELRMEENVKPIVQACRSTLKTLRFKFQRNLAPTEIKNVSAMTFLNDVDLDLELHVGTDVGYNFCIEYLAKMQSLTHLFLREEEVVGLHKLAAFPKLRAITFTHCNLGVDEKKKILKAPGKLKCIEFFDCVLLTRDGDEAVRQYNFTWIALAES